MNMMQFPLNRLPEGRQAIVTGLLSHGTMRRRLMDIGLVEGTGWSLQKSPAGDPVAYFIRGAVIAIRSEDSSQVMVSGLDAPPETI